MDTDRVLSEMADALARVPGVVGVALGGSRARGDHRADSDIDLGIYYLGAPDVSTLSDLTATWSEQRVEVGAPGSWGPWVNAGAWLTVDGTSVDWILRDLDRVRQQWVRAQRGEFAFHVQAGHPLGFLDVAYAGELALGVLLADPSGTLAALRQETRSYPPALQEAMIRGLWEAGFLISAARKGARRQDAGYVVLCLARALMLCAHALHAHAGAWVTNEKGLLPGVARLDHAPHDFAGRAARALGIAGTSAESLAAAVEEAGTLVQETTDLVSLR